MNSSWWKAAVKYGLGVAVLAAVIYFNYAGLRDTLSRPINYPWYAGAAALYVVNTFLTFLRWYLLVRAQGLPFTVRSAVRLGLVGNFFNTFLPGSVGGDLLKAAFIAREQDRRTVAVATVLIDRGVGLWGLIVVVALTGSAFWALGDAAVAGSAYLRQTVRIALAVLAATLAVWGLLGVLPERRAERFGRRLAWLPRVGRVLQEFWGAVWLYRAKGRVVLAALLMSLVGHTCSVLMMYCIVRAFQPAGAAPDMPGLTEHFLLVPVFMIAQGFFPAPGGVGGGELVLGFLYEVVGRPQHIGVLGSLGQRALSWLLGMVGFAVYLFLKRDLPSPAEVRDVAESAEAGLASAASPGHDQRLQLPGGEV